MSKTLVKNTVIYSIGEILPRLLGFILLPIYTHYLSPTDYGIINYTSAVIVFLPILSTLCLNSYLLRFYFEKETETDKKKLIGNAFLFIALTNLLIFILGYIFLPKLLSSYKVKVLWNPYFKLAFIAFFLDVFSIVPMIIYRVKQNATTFVYLSLGKTLLQYIFILSLIIYYKKGVLGYYYGMVFALIPFFIIYWIVIIKNSILNFNWQQIKEGLKFSLPLLPAAIAYLLIDFFDRILLERYVPLSEIGLYSLAYTLSFSLNIIIFSVYKSIEPEIFKRFNDDNFGEFISKSKAIFFFVIYLSAMCVALFSQEFFKIVAPPNYFKGYLYVPIILVGVIMTGQNVIYSGILAAEKKTRIMGLATFIGVAFNIAFNIIFIPIYGAYAAAISTAISFGLTNIVLYINIKIEKTIKGEVIALSLFLTIVTVLFFILSIEHSLKFTFLKLLILILYLFCLIKAFNVKPRGVLRQFNNKINF